MIAHGIFPLHKFFYKPYYIVTKGSMTILHGVSHVLMTPKGAALLKELKEINKKYYDSNKIMWSLSKALASEHRNLRSNVILPAASF